MSGTDTGATEPESPESLSEKTEDKDSPGVEVGLEDGADGTGTFEPEEEDGR